MFIKEDQFLSQSFHTAIEKAPPVGVQPYYCIIRKGSAPIGICYFQLKLLKLKEALKIDEPNPFYSFLKITLSSRINFYSLVCGNSMVTGQYGYRFISGMDRNTMYYYAVNAANHLSKKLKNEKGIQVGPVLFKDYYARQLYPKDQLEHFIQFEVQPMMTMYIDPEWDKMEDYLGAMRTKYRTRAKRCFKKLGDIKIVEMSAEMISENRGIMYEMYLSIAEEASFNLFFLDMDYFYNLKCELKNKLLVIGYFEGDQLVGFYTLIKNNKSLDAHFLGYDKSLNGPKQIYLNMLYDMIEKAIELKYGRVYMSRTALEIKSSVGAVSEHMYCYIKHNKSIYNRFLPGILNVLVPKEKWIPRNPFK